MSDWPTILQRFAAHVLVVTVVGAAVWVAAFGAPLWYGLTAALYGASIAVVLAFATLPLEDMGGEPDA